jgi:hypothetical protein
MRKALGPFSISPKVTGGQLLPRRRRSDLHTRGTTHPDVNGGRWPRRLLVACHSRNANGMGGSLHPARTQSDTGALKQKEQEEEKWVRKAKVKLSLIPN